MTFSTKILTNDQGKQKSPTENVKCYKRDHKIIVTRKKKLLMLLIIQTFSIFHTAKNFCCFQIPITFIVTQCLIFLFLSFHSFRQSLVTIKIKNKYFWESKKKRNRTMETFMQPLHVFHIHSISMCVCRLYICRIPPKRYNHLLSIFTPKQYQEFCSAWCKRIKVLRQGFLV